MRTAQIGADGCGRDGRHSRGGVEMGLKVHPGIVSLGNECYVMAASIQAIYPRSEEEQVDTILPGHGSSTGKSVVLLRDGAKLGVCLKPDTVLSRYLKATRGDAVETT